MSRLDGCLENEHLRPKAGVCLAANTVHLDPMEEGKEVLGCSQSPQGEHQSPGAPTPGPGKEPSGPFGPHEPLLDST